MVYFSFSSFSVSHLVLALSLSHYLVSPLHSHVNEFFTIIYVNKFYFINFICHICFHCTINHIWEYDFPRKSINLKWEKQWKVAGWLHASHEHQPFSLTLSAPLSLSVSFDLYLALSSRYCVVAANESLCRSDNKISFPVLCFHLSFSRSIFIYVFDRMNRLVRGVKLPQSLINYDLCK